MRFVSAHQLDPEPAEAVAGDIHREEPAVADAPPPVDEDERRENQQVPQQLVEERGVHDRDELARRHPVQVVQRTGSVASLVDFQAPRQRGLAAVELLVEVVPQSADRLRENDSRRDGVAEGRQRNAQAAACNPRTDAAERDRTPDAQAAVPDAQGPDQTGAALAEVLRPVGDDVVEPTADEAERHGPQDDVVDDARLAAPGDPASVTDQQGGDDARDDEQRVGAQGYRTELPDTLRRTRDVGEDGRRHAVTLCRTPSASSSVNDRIAGMPSLSADTSAEPTMTPSA